MKIELIFTATSMIFSAIFSLPLVSFAQAGTLDLSFGTNGVVTTPFGTGNDLGKAVAIQTDGRILVAGYSYNGSNNDFALVRYNTDGSLDTTFDNDGKVITSIGTGDDFGNSIAIQTDGKILVAGYSYNGSNNDFALVRYNTIGSLDTTFDNDGKVTTSIGAGNDVGYSIAIQTDGKILVAGYSYNGSTNVFALIRYNLNGSLDTTFDTDGEVTTNFGVLNATGNSITLQSDDKILVAGTAGTFIGSGSDQGFALARYNTNGSLDTSLDNDGKATTVIIGSYANYGQSVIVQIDGKILVTGHSNFGAGPLLALIRYNSNGSLDATFDNDGIVTATSVYSMGYAAVLQPDNKILVAGWRDTTSLSSHHTFALTRFSTNGSLDPTFGTYGIASVSIGIDNASYSIAFQTDSKILIVGHSYDSNYNFDFALARFHSDTCPSVSFAQSLTMCSGQNISVGSNTYNSNGIYIDTLISLFTGCDSIVTTNLTVLPIYTFSQALTICSGDSIYIGSNFYNSSGIYIDTLTSLFTGCDSIVTTNLTVLTANTFSQALTICSGDSIYIGSNIYNSSGTYIDTLISVFTGCDSIVTTYLTVPSTNLFSQTLTICSGQSISVGSNTYNSSGAYTDTLISLLTGCDSIVATNLTVSPIPILTISFDGIQIYSNQNLAGYQWIDCGNGNFPLAGETNQTFTPTMNGNFGVIVTLGLCTDTSDCLNIISLRDNEILNLFTEISIYPNPFSSSTILQSNYLLDNAIVNVYNIYGQQVKQMSNLYGHIISLNLDNLPRGLYFIRLDQEDKLILSNKLVIKD